MSLLVLRSVGVRGHKHSVIQLHRVSKAAATGLVRGRRGIKQNPIMSKIELKTIGVFRAEQGLNSQGRGIGGHGRPQSKREQQRPAFEPENGGVHFSIIAPQF